MYHGYIFNTDIMMNYTKHLRKVNFADLQSNNKYIIVNIHKTTPFVGIFDEYGKPWDKIISAVFKEVIEINPLEMDDNMYYLLGDIKKNESVWTNLEYEELKHNDEFYKYDTIFYDLKEINENGEKARQHMGTTRARYYFKTTRE